MLTISDRIYIMSLVEKELLDIYKMWEIATDKKTKKEVKDGFNNLYNIYTKLQNLSNKKIILNSCTSSKIKNLFLFLNS